MNLLISPKVISNLSPLQWVQFFLEKTSWVQELRNKLGNVEQLKGSPLPGRKSCSGTISMAPVFEFDSTPSA